MKKNFCPAFLALLSLPLHAIERYPDDPIDFSYRFVEVASYSQKAQIDVGLPNDEVKGSGYGVTGSYNFGWFLVQIGYIDGEVDEAWGYNVHRDLRAETDFKQTSLTLGAIHKVTDDTAIQGGLTVEREELEGSYSDQYFSISARQETTIVKAGIGMRTWLVRLLEFSADAGLLSIDTGSDRDTDAEIAFGVRMHFFEHASMGLTHSQYIDMDSSVFKVDLRAQF